MHYFIAFQFDSNTLTSRCKKWTHWDLNPGPSACEADVIPLHHVPVIITLQSYAGLLPNQGRCKVIFGVQACQYDAHLRGVN